MQFNHGVLFLVLLITFQCHSSNVLDNIPSTELEESIKFKLRTAASIRNNIGKIFNQLKSSDWELSNSLEQIKNYLKNGGSLIESLHLLPELSYATVDKQFNGILTALEESSPRYLLPAISVIRNAFADSSDSLNIEDVLQPNGGPLRVDIFEGILAQDLPRLVLPTPFPKDVERHTADSLLPSFIQKVFISISMGFLNGSSPILGLIFENLVNFSHGQKKMKIIKQFSQNIDDDGRGIVDLKLGSDPYESLKNMLSKIGKRNSAKWNGEGILMYLNEKLKIRENVPEIADFFADEKINYSLILSNDKQFVKTESAKALLLIIQNNECLLKNALNDFQIYEYRTPDDIFMAVVSKLRRYQAHEGTISEVIDNVYKKLIGKSRHAVWKQIPRSAGALKALLENMKTDKNAKKIRRLADDISVSLESNVKPEAWLKIQKYVPKINCYGPSCTVLRTLEGIQELEAIEDQALNVSVIELIKFYKRYYGDKTFDSCPNFLNSDLFANMEPTKTPKKTLINVDDLFQAIPRLDIKSKEYKVLRKFLSTNDLDERIGENIDIEAHPTRGRLLTWLLEKIEGSNDIEEEIRNAAARFSDSVSYDGYGAGRVLVRPTSWSVQ